MSRRCGDADQQTFGRERLGRAPARGSSRQEPSYPAQRAPARGVGRRAPSCRVPTPPARRVGRRAPSRRVPTPPARRVGRRAPSRRVPTPPARGRRAPSRRVPTPPARGRRGPSRRVPTPPARGVGRRAPSRRVTTPPARGRDRRAPSRRVTTPPARGRDRQVSGFQEPSQVESYRSSFSHVDSRTGHYQRTTCTQEASTGQVFRERGSGRTGYGDELKTTTTVCVGDSYGYDEHQVEERFRRVNLGNSGRMGYVGGSCDSSTSGDSDSSSSGGSCAEVFVTVVFC